jgi:2',3'-cyclic-nucleotide 2'-phosphodiesterase (5'-nucleotidase family)
VTVNRFSPFRLNPPWLLALSAAILFLLPRPLFSREIKFTILFTNDHHGQVEPQDPPDASGAVGGVSRRMALIEKIRNEVGPSRVVLVDGGDLFTGSALSGLTRGEVDCAAYQLMKYDAIALGNHDFDYGKKIIEEYQSRKSFGTPWVSANVVVPGNYQNFARPYVIRNVPGLRLGLTGFSNPGTPGMTRRDNVRGLMFQPAGASAKGLHSILKKDADVFIALSHLGADEDKKFAKDNPFLHVIIGGHSHTKLDEAIVEKKRDGSPAGPLIVQAGSRGLFLGRLDLTVDAVKDPNTKKESFAVAGFHYELIPITADLPEEPRMVELLKKYEENARKAHNLDEVITSAEEKIERSKTGDSLMGQLTADAVREATGSEAALVNSGSFRRDIPAGSFTQKNLYELLPFEDGVVVLQVSGYYLRKILELSALNQGQDAFLQISGMKVEKSGDGFNITVGDNPIMDRQKYLVAVNDYLADGGDGYKMFRGFKSRRNTDLILRKVLGDYLKKKQKISPSDLVKRWSL